MHVTFTLDDAEGGRPPLGGEGRGGRVGAEGGTPSPTGGSGPERGGGGGGGDASTISTA